ncbi:MAG: hypothetical protein U0996_26535 [Planctomycetaceae bacterium]
MLRSSRRTHLRQIAGAASAAFLPATLWTTSTSATGMPANRIPKIAAVVTIYRPFSHSDVILGKILEGWKQDGGRGPALKLVSMYVDQFPSDDMARKMSAKHNVPIFDSIEKAITLGGDSVAVDGVLSIGEHGDYPFSKLGQQLYPRRRFFSEIATTFEKHGKVVPVFNDKHLGPAWEDGLWMWNRAKELKIPFMAGSSMPVGYRKSDVMLPMNSPIEAAVGIGYSGLDVYGFHALEFLQWHLERRPGAEQGVRNVQCLQGERLWKAVDDGTVPVDLLKDAFAAIPGSSGVDMRADRNATAFLFEYHDGLKAAQFMFQCIAGTGCALRIKGQPVYTNVFDERTEPMYPHFACLLKAIERMMYTGRPTYPVERTVLTGGVLDRALTSLAEDSRKLETPELSIAYQPIDYPFGQHVDLLTQPYGQL